MSNSAHCFEQTSGDPMSLFLKNIVFEAAIAALNGAAHRQQQPPFAATKLDDTDNAGARKT
jgi:hypothetical protein